MVDYSLHNRSLKVLQKLSFNFTFLNEVQAGIMEHIIDRFLLSRCQKKCYEQCYDIIKEFESKRLVFMERQAVKLWIHVIDTICRISIIHGVKTSSKFSIIVLSNFLRNVVSDYLFFVVTKFSMVILRKHT